MEIGEERISNSATRFAKALGTYWDAFGELRIAGETDRIYEDAPSEVVLKVGTGAGVQIQNENWSDCVVWNPWTSMEACYKEFVCVENAKTAQKVRVGPNESWRARADFAVVDLI